jgi:DNA mismatch repair protein MSH6
MQSDSEGEIIPIQNTKRVKFIGEDQNELPMVVCCTPSRELSKFSFSDPLSSVASKGSANEHLIGNPSPSAYTPSKSAQMITSAEKKNARQTTFSEKNKTRYAWLSDPRDAEKRSPEDPDYDHRTLFIPDNAWKSFTPFEKQFWVFEKLIIGD